MLFYIYYKNYGVICIATNYMNLFRIKINFNNKKTIEIKIRKQNPDQVFLGKIVNFFELQKKKLT